MEERKILVARTAGFCFGVKRAVEKVYEQVNMGKQNIYTYGPIIHNEEVIADLKRKGVQVIHSLEEAKEQAEGTVIIRSHGVTKAEQETLVADGLRVIDATCPFVKKIHRLVQEYSDKGYLVIIIGSVDHPEVQGIVGWSHADRTVVINCESDVEKLDLNACKKVCIVAQTTFNYNKFKELVEILEKKSYDVSVLNTICNATKERQTEAQSIAETVDAMIVIGDKHSSNTQKLFEICRKACNNTYYIQTLGDLDLNQLGSVETVGITAGASTPNNIIEEVQNNVRIIF